MGKRSHPRWTGEQIELLKGEVARASDYSSLEALDASVAVAIGRSLAAVRQKRVDLRLTLDCPRGFRQRRWRHGGKALFAAANAPDNRTPHAAVAAMKACERAAVVTGAYSGWEAARIEAEWGRLADHGSIRHMDEFLADALGRTPAAIQGYRVRKGLTERSANRADRTSEEAP